MSMVTSAKIEFISWKTPFTGNEIHILSAAFSRDNEFGLGIKNDKHYLIKNTQFQNPASTDLLVRVFNATTEEVYQVQFHNVGAYRILDEHGLQELYDENNYEFDVNKNAPSTFPTFKVRHHGWPKESPLSFFMGTDDGWSHMIMTGWDCIEVLTTSEPIVILERKVESIIGPLENSIIEN